MLAELRDNPRVRALGMLGGVVLVAGLLSLGQVSLVRAAGAGITVAITDQAIPATDPFAAAWQKVPVTNVPLSAQQIWQPGGGSVQAVQVRALRNDQQVAFLVSWADTSKNDTAVNMPSDAAAIQLPLDPTNLPYQCMGQSTSRVNIWQWKAALEAEARDSEGAIPYNNTRNLTSNGICRAVDTDGVHPVASSTWRDGRWYVIFTRALAASNAGTAPLLPGASTNAAFAIWDGGKGETRSMKAVSTWTPIDFGSPSTNLTSNVLTISALLAIGALVIFLGFRFLPRRG